MPEEKIKSIIFFVLISGILALNSCDAPRENPLDPNSKDNLLGTIDGTVQTFSLPYTPINNVAVLWKPGNILVFTDTSGNFTIPNIKTENGTLIFTKEGYHTDTVQVTWDNARKISKEVNLNKIPLLDSLSIYTVVMNLLNPQSQMSELVFHAKIVDVDNDIDTVSVLNDQIGLMKTMDFNVASKTYQAVLTTDELNLNSIEETIGLEFDFRVRDVLGDIYILHGGGVSRIIQDQVVGLQPDNDMTINSLPFNLDWNSTDPGYSFHYKVEVYTNDVANPQLVLSQDNISSQDTTYLVNTMDAGNYWWVVWIVDDFNNMARSLPATFIVQ